MATAEYQRAWKLKNRESFLANQRSYYHSVRKFNRPTRRKNPEKRCEFCEIPLISKYGSKFGTKYCTSCKYNRAVKRLLNARYQRTAYRKRVSIDTPE